jgi:hypothetical protein
MICVCLCVLVCMCAPKSRGLAFPGLLCSCPFWHLGVVTWSHAVKNNNLQGFLLFFSHHIININIIIFFFGRSKRQRNFCLFFCFIREQTLFSPLTFSLISRANSNPILSPYLLPHIPPIPPPHPLTLVSVACRQASIASKHEAKAV